MILLCGMKIQGKRKNLNDYKQGVFDVAMRDETIFKIEMVTTIAECVTVVHL
jgi:hypothetical protein